jgi:hypothetical protein
MYMQGQLARSKEELSSRNISKTKNKHEENGQDLPHAMRVMADSIGPPNCVRASICPLSPKQAITSVLSVCTNFCFHIVGVFMNF